MKQVFKNIYGRLWLIRKFGLPWTMLFIELDAERDNLPSYYKGKLDALKAISDYALSNDRGTFRHFCYDIMEMHYADCQLNGGLDLNNWLIGHENSNPQPPPE